MECQRKWLQENFQAVLEDDDCEYLFASTFMNKIRASFEIQKKRKHGGSYSRKKLNLEKERKGGQDRMERDYFCATLVYDDGLFKRRFRMRKTYILM